MTEPRSRPEGVEDHEHEFAGPDDVCHICGAERPGEPDWEGLATELYEAAQPFGLRPVAPTFADQCRLADACKAFERSRQDGEG